MTISRKDIADLETALQFMADLGRCHTIVSNRVLRALLEDYQRHEPCRANPSEEAPQAQRTAPHAPR